MWHSANKKAFKLDEAIRSYQIICCSSREMRRNRFVRLQVGNLHATKGNYAQAIKDFELVPGGPPSAPKRNTISARPTRTCMKRPPRSMPSSAWGPWARGTANFVSPAYWSCEST